MGRRRGALSPGEWAVLGAVAEEPAHGFAIARLLAPTGPLGRIWAMPRPLVYQAIKRLIEDGLVVETATARSDRGPQRTILAVTPAGRRALHRWLLEPVEHVRDVRSQLLLKLALLDRAGRDPAPLLAAQAEQLGPQIEALAERCHGASGFDATLSLWRLESSRAVLRFVDALRSGPAGARPGRALTAR